MVIALLAAAFFIPQTPQVNMDVCGLKRLERVARSSGVTALVISSGRRDIKETKKLLEQRKRREGLTKYRKAQSVIDEVLLRGFSPEQLTYPKGRWYAKAAKALRKIDHRRMYEIMRKISRARRDFAGYESGHLQGKKVDVPVSYFYDRYGDDGFVKYKNFKNALEKNGYKILEEPRAGARGVLDITLNCSPNRGRD